MLRRLAKARGEKLSFSDANHTQAYEALKSLKRVATTLSRYRHAVEPSKISQGWV